MATGPATAVAANVVDPKAPKDAPLNVTMIPAIQRPRAMRFRSNISKPPVELASEYRDTIGDTLGHLTHPACSVRTVLVRRSLPGASCD